MQMEPGTGRTKASTRRNPRICRRYSPARKAPIHVPAGNESERPLEGAAGCFKVTCGHSDEFLKPIIFGFFFPKLSKPRAFDTRSKARFRGFSHGEGCNFRFRRYNTFTVPHRLKVFEPLRGSADWARRAHACECPCFPTPDTSRFLKSEMQSGR